MNILLIRHGESATNAGRPTDDPALTPLTPTGHAQSAQVAERVASAPALIIRSPFGRSDEAIQPLVARYPDTPVETWPLQEFTYLDPGDYGRLSRQERAAAKSAYWQAGDPGLRLSAGSESFRDFAGRVLPAIESLRQEQRFVVASLHGHVIRLMMLWLIEGRIATDEKGFARYRALRTALKIPNASIVRADFSRRVMSGFEVGHLG